MPVHFALNGTVYPNMPNTYRHSTGRNSGSAAPQATARSSTSKAATTPTESAVPVPIAQAKTPEVSPQPEPIAQPATTPTATTETPAEPPKVLSWAERAKLAKEQAAAAALAPPPAAPVAPKATVPAAQKVESSSAKAKAKAKASSSTAATSSNNSKTENKSGKSNDQQKSRQDNKSKDSKQQSGSTASKDSNKEKKASSPKKSDSNNNNNFDNTTDSINNKALSEQEKQTTAPEPDSWAARLKVRAAAKAAAAAAAAEVKKEPEVVTVATSTPSTEQDIVKKEKRSDSISNKQINNTTTSTVTPANNIEEVTSVTPVIEKVTDVKSQVPDTPTTEKPVVAVVEEENNKMEEEEEVEVTTSQTSCKETASEQIEENTPLVNEESIPVPSTITKNQDFSDGEDDLPPAGLDALAVAQARASFSAAQAKIVAYSLDDLLKYKDRAECKELPTGHKIPANLLKGANPGRDRSQGHGGKGGRNGGRSGGNYGRGGNKGGRFNKNKEEEGPLEPLPAIGENSWTAKVRTKEDPVEVRQREMRSILNKLTMEKFDTLSTKLLSLDLNMVDITILNRLIFEKAITQHHFINMYADLCLAISTQVEKWDDVDGIPAQRTFRNDLISVVQEYFSTINVIGLADQQNALKANPESEELLERYFKHKQKMLGNVRFIGALLMRKIIPPPVINSITKELLEAGGEDHLESIVAFLTVIGCMHDPAKKGRDLDPAFAKLEAYANSTCVTGQRIVCLIKDLLDLRKRGFVTKDFLGATKGPTNLEEIRQQASAEERQAKEETQRNKDAVRNMKHKPSANPPSSSASKDYGRSAPRSPTANQKPVAVVEEKKQVELTYEEAKKRLSTMIKEIKMIKQFEESLETFKGLEIWRSTYLRSLLKELFTDVINNSTQRDVREPLFKFMACIITHNQEVAEIARKAFFDFLDDEEMGFAFVKDEFPRAGEIIAEDLLDAIYAEERNDVFLFDRSDREDIMQSVGYKMGHQESSSSSESESESESESSSYSNDEEEEDDKQSK